jgi:hypothetical protein
MATAPKTDVGRANGGAGFGYQTMTNAVSKLLGMSADDIHAARDAGQSLVQIAQSKGKTETDLINALMAERKAAIEARVKAGTLTQAQADAALKLMTERIKQAVNRAEHGPFGPTESPRLGLGRGDGQGQPGEGSGPRMLNRWGGQPPTTR